jgi:chromosome segregation protein
LRIKKLELIGFKSFKDRTVIHFDAGITGIVGPNGCGKSNIVDALVWVMGEMSAKHLRGAAMSDVIFAGAEGYAPMGMAEVSLTLENDGGPFPVKYLKHSEIMITRRLHRSGDSEYLINKETARLKDVHEVFMDTGAGSKGFSIIEQGAIGKIITAKPEDRRVLIEEAAGITKFKVRKRESQRKLISTEQNLTRLQDILGEQRRQLDSLERQAQRAERYRNLKRDLQEKEVVLASKSYLALHKEFQQLEVDLVESREKEASFEADVSEQDAKIQSLRLELLEKEKAVESFQTGHGEAQKISRDLEFQIRELNFEIEQTRRSKEMTGSILEQSRARSMALEEDLTRVTVDLATNSAKYEEVKAAFTEKSAEFVGIQSRIQAVDQELTIKRREMLTVSQSATHWEAREQSLNEKISDQQTRVEHVHAVAGELNTQRTDFEKRRNQIFSKLEVERQFQLDIMKDVGNFEENARALENQVNEKQIEVGKFKDSLNEVASRLYGLENLQANFEGFEEGVKQVMLWQRSEAVQHADGSQSLQPVSELVEVPEKFELAMEAALGNKLQLLVGDSGSTALSAVDYLKSTKGRSSFATNDWVPTTSGESITSIGSEDGVEALLQDVVKIPEKVQPVVAHFFKDVIVVDSIRTALRLRALYAGKTFVTLDGDCLSADGVLTGGSAGSADSGIIQRRREIKELSQKREEWSGKLALAQASLTKTEARFEQVSEELENAKKKNNEKEIHIAELKKDFERAENEFNNAVNAVAKSQTDVSKEEAQLQKLNDEIGEVSEKLIEMRTRRMELETSVNQLDEEYRRSREGIDDLQKTVTELQVESASKGKEVEALQARSENLTKSLLEVKTQVDQMSAQSEQSETSLSAHSILVEQQKLEFEQAVQKTESMFRDLGAAKDLFEEASAEVRELEAALNRHVQGRHANQTKLSEMQLRLEQVRMKEQYLVDQINERYMMILADIAPTYAETEVDVPALEKEVGDLKSKLGKIGEVNLSSIEEYEDLVKRHQFLDQQFKDLNEAKEQLKKVIDRINRICSKRFKETFEQVNERFMKVFPVLFGGGEAKLILIEDPENGEMGIDIVSRPPGKKMQNVTLLSGGEKALTAVSLIFSIFLVKPSPFCLLDEVDAPLDDANVFRFNDLVKEMAKRSQLIIVTHNKHTMRVNNTLYGVTMEERGVSKMVSVKLEGAGAEAAQAYAQLV